MHPFPRVMGYKRESDIMEGGITDVKVNHGMQYGLTKNNIFGRKLTRVISILVRMLCNPMWSFRLCCSKC